MRPPDPRATAALVETYQDLHQHPELSFAETRTAGVVAAELERLGFGVITGLGGTGVVGVLENGPGPAVLLRADMDGLPVLEQTGLAYASTARATGADGHEVPVMHACGHDVHVTCLLGACQVLVDDRAAWTGSLIVVFQPAEELGTGAQAMIDDGLFERVPQPSVVLGQHVAPFPAGWVGLREGPAFAAADSLRITLFGRGGHGSRPETTVDPVLLAASTVVRLHTIVSREVAGTETAILTVGALRAGTKENIIGDTAELLVSIRSFDPDVRARVLGAVDRVVAGEAMAAGSPRPPTVESMASFPAVVNDPEATRRAWPGLAEAVGEDRLVVPEPVTGSEDVGLLAAAADVPCVYWLLGGSDPRAFADATGLAELLEVVATLPSNHSPLFAPVPRPTIETGVAALVGAARQWLRT